MQDTANEPIDNETVSLKVPKWFFRFVRWRVNHISGRTLLIVASVLTGVMAGIAAWLLRVLIDFVTHHLLKLINPSGFNLLLLVLPLVGLLLAVAFQRYVVHDEMDHSEGRLRKDFSNGNFRLKSHLIWAPLVGCPITLGFGGSAGSEGPAAVMGAASGSFLAKYLGCDKLLCRSIVACGAGAGIAGIFTAPIAGVMFAVEVLSIELTSFAVLMLFVSCICAATTSYVLSGSSLNLTFFVDQTPSIEFFWIFLIFGLFCGLYSTYYTALVALTDKLLSKVPGIWRTVAAGLGLGVIIFMLPDLYGEGYGLIRHLESKSTDYSYLTSSGFFHDITSMGPALIIIVAASLLVKSIAVNMTNSGGGVAGIFTPTMVAGVLCGTIFAHFANVWCDAHLSVPLFAFIGMAGVMAGVIRAPLLGTFVTIEVSGCYLLLIPVAIVAFSSYYVRMRINPGDVILSPTRLLSFTKN